MLQTRKIKHVKNTVAVVARVFIGDLPYTRSFLDYYKKIGADEIYLIITNNDEENFIKSYLSSNPFVKFIVSATRIIKMPVLSGLLKDIETDFILNVDIDEYLDIKNIKQIFTEEKADKYHFYWNITVQDGFSDETKGFDAHFSKKPYKTMCRTKNIKYWKDSHNCYTTSNTTTKESKYKLVHYYGRSFNDIVIKSIYGKNYNNRQKITSLEEIMQSIQSPNVNDLPNRLKMLAVVSRVPKTNDIMKIPIKIDYKLEKKLLQDFNTDALFAKYKKFRKQLDCNQVSQYFKQGLSGIDFKALRV